jgi:hypothetical protein
MSHTRYRCPFGAPWMWRYNARAKLQGDHISLLASASTVNKPLVSFSVR